ncbi:MAG: alpha/beta hydrolase [Planctomycetota bacterium]
MRLAALLLAAALLAACAAPPPAGGGSGTPPAGLGPPYVHVAGAGEGLLLVLGAAWLEADFAALEPGARIAFADLPGRGRSSAHPASVVPSLARDVADLATIAADLAAPRLSILAWSYEAAVALRYAISHPGRVERLVLVAPLPPRRDPHWDAFRRAAAQRTSDEEVARLDHLAAQGPAARRAPAFRRLHLAAQLRASGADPALLAVMAADPYPPPNDDPYAVSERGQRILAQLGDWDWRPELAGLEAEVLVVHGRSDSLPAAGAEELVAALPHAELLLLEEAGRFPWLEAPAAFFAAVNRFLSAEGGAEAAGER